MKITKETLRRAGRTFLQAALGYVVANLCVIDFSAADDVLWSALIGLAVSAIAAGAAALMNLEKTEEAE